MGRIPLEWDSGGSLGVMTSSYAGEIEAAFRGFDTSRFLKSMISELTYGNENVDISTRIRNGNPRVVEHARSINSVTKGRRFDG